MKKKFNIKKITGIISFIFFIFLGESAKAQLVNGADNKCIKNGDCQLSDLMQVAITSTQIMLSVVGAITLLAFVYGGVLFLISSGNSETVSKAKRTITGSVIGMLIVFLSFMIINLVFRALGVEGNWWTSDWFF